MIGDSVCICWYYGLKGTGFEFIIFNRFNKCRGRLKRDRIWLV